MNDFICHYQVLAGFWAYLLTSLDYVQALLQVHCIPCVNAKITELLVSKGAQLMATDSLQC